MKAKPGNIFPELSFNDTLSKHYHAADPAIGYSKFIQFPVTENFIVSTNEEPQWIINEQNINLPVDTPINKNRDTWPYNETAIWSMAISGIAGLSYFILFPLGIIGGILGIISLGQFKKNPFQKGRGFAYASIIIGILSLIMLAAVILFIILCSQPDASCFG